MYRNVTCWNTGNTYQVTNTENIPVGVNFYTREDDGFYSPVKKVEYVEFDVKPSIYHRPIFRCVADEYKYKFSTKKVETKTTVKDVYYNSRRNKYITRTHENNTERRFISF